MQNVEKYTQKNQTEKSGILGAVALHVKLHIPVIPLNGQFISFKELRERSEQSLYKIPVFSNPLFSHFSLQVCADNKSSVEVMFKGSFKKNLPQKDLLENDAKNSLVKIVMYLRSRARKNRRSLTFLAEVTV